MDGFFLSNWVYEGLKWLHEVVLGGGSYFWTIVIFTVILKLVTLPTDIKQRSSSAKMAALNPELEKLKKKYANDPRKMQEMQAALYKKHGVSMFSSCLPLLITMPIFFAFFGAMRVWANDYAVRMVLELSEGSTALFDSFKWLWVNNIFQPDTGLAQILMPMEQFQTQVVAAVQRDLTSLAANPSAMTLFSKETMDRFMAIAPNYETIIQPVMQRFVAGVDANGAATYLTNGWFILPALAGLSNYFSQWIQRKLQPQQAQQPGMGKGMTIMMVGISVYFCIQSPAAFAIYWLTSNVCQLILQLVLGKAFADKSKQLAEGSAQ